MSNTPESDDPLFDEEAKADSAQIGSGERKSAEDINNLGMVEFVVKGIKKNAKTIIDSYKKWYDEYSPMTESRQAVRAAVAIVEWHEKRVQEMEAKVHELEAKILSMGGPVKSKKKSMLDRLKPSKSRKPGTYSPPK